MVTLHSAILLAVVIVCLIVFLRRRGRTNKRLPPSPWQFPVVGNIPQFLIQGKTPIFETALRWQGKYGNIFITNLGAVRIVWIGGLELAREVLQNRGSKFDSRPNWMTLIQETRQNEGILYNSGETYRQLRSLLQNATEACSSDDLIYEEVEFFTKTVEKLAREGKSVQPESLVRSSFVNILYGIIFGHRLQSEKLSSWTDLIGDIKSENKVINIADILPALAFLSFRKKNSLLSAKLMDFHKIMRDEIRTHRKTFNLHGPVDLIDFYIDAKKKGTDISENNLLCLILDCFLADTSAEIFLWVLSFIVSHKNVQERCRVEIIKEVGKYNHVNEEDLERLPYTRATILEALRLAGNQLTYLHATFKDTKLADYFIPKHSIVVVNLASIHLDPQLWEQPLEFRPDRFLNANGKGVQYDHFCPYGLGNRKCTMQRFSEKELIFFLVNIVRRFKIETSPEWGPVDTAAVQDSFHLPVRPKPFYVDFIELQ